MSPETRMKKSISKSEKKKFLIFLFWKKIRFFYSIREAAKTLPISPVILAKKLDSGLSFKGYYYYSKPLNV